MDTPKISVIMSAYNESLDELNKSILSIINQTYHEFEFIIVSDNPRNQNIKEAVGTANDQRIKFIENEKNIGLVKSLNKAFHAATGQFIARMDADDISYTDRLFKQIEYLQKNKLDIVGGNMDVIDEEDNIIGAISFPKQHNQIKYFLKWGNCIAHPTWLVNKHVYDELNGYRNIPNCEDYDFVCRAIQMGFRVGNVGENVLQYRMRDKSISNSNRGKQYVLRDYIAKRRKQYLSEQTIKNYINSNEFATDVQKYDEFQTDKKLVMENKNVYCLIRLLKNKYTYKLILERIALLFRGVV